MLWFSLYIVYGSVRGFESLIRSIIPLFFDAPVKIALSSFRSHILSLIVEFFARCDTNLHFDLAVLEVHLERD